MTTFAARRYSTRLAKAIAAVLPQSKQELAFVRVSGNTLAEEHP
jgi:ribosomal protein L18E